MTRNELIAKLVADRAVFDAKVGVIPPERFSDVPSGYNHSPKDIVFHVNAYEELIAERLRSARAGETTAFDRDRDGWEAFNDRVWTEAAEADVMDVLDRLRTVFGDLLQEVRKLSDAELVALDGFEHYRMHHAALDAAATG